MKKFTKKIFVFVLLIAIATMTVNYIYMKRHKADEDKFALIPDRIQICNFGSSHGMRNINYENLENEYNCFNFGLSAQSLSYDYRLFQYYGDHIDNGTVVFIPVSYFSLFGIDETSLEGFASKNRRYYSILPASLIKDYDSITDIYVSYFPALITGTGDLVKTLLGKSKTSVDEAGQKVATDIDISKNAKATFNSHVGDIQRFYNDNGNRIVNQEETDALYALIKGCQEKGAIPILITTPYLHEYTDEVKENTEDFYDQFYSLVDQVVKDTGVEYYDYAFDERFSSEYSWFINCDHLNKEGAKIFVDILMQEIVYKKGYF